MPGGIHAVAAECGSHLHREQRRSAGQASLVVFLPRSGGQAGAMLQGVVAVPA